MSFADISKKTGSPSVGSSPRPSWLARPTPAAIAEGAGLFALGAAVRTWAAGHIRKGEVLAVTGPYAHTRNPLYFGSFLMACGALVMGRNGWLAAAFLLIAVPVYRSHPQGGKPGSPVVSGSHSPLMPGRCRGFSRVSLSPRTAAGGFHWGLVWRHRERHAWIGGAILTLVMLARWFWASGR